MHHRNAPAVQYPVGRSRVEGLLILLATVSGVAGACAWAWQLDAAPWHSGWHWDARPWAMALLTAGLASVAAWSWWRTPTGLLVWDGSAWSWSALAGGAVRGVQLAADLQAAMLLRLIDARGRTMAWLWAHRASAPAQWKPLRRALVSSGLPQEANPGTSVAARSQAAQRGEPA